MIAAFHVVNRGPMQPGTPYSAVCETAVTVVVTRHPEEPHVRCVRNALECMLEGVKAMADEYYDRDTSTHVRGRLLDLVEEMQAAAGRL